MTEKTETDRFLEIIQEDIKILRVGIEEYGIKLIDKKYPYLMNFELFIEMTKKYCFKNKSETIYRQTSIISPDTESEMIPVTIIPVPEERLELFNTNVLQNFDEMEIFTLSYALGSHSETYSRERMYYRFFYALCHETNWISINIKDDYLRLLNQWNRALEHKKMSVDLLIPLNTISVQGSDTLIFENKFKIKNILHGLLEKAEGGVNDSFFYSTLIFYNTELLVKIFTSDSFGHHIFREDKDGYIQQYQEQLKDLHLFVDALYLNRFNFKWRKPILKLPWWFNPELYELQNLQRGEGEVSFIKEDDIERVSLTYSNLKTSQILEKDNVILNSYFRFFQHDLIDIYFIIDAFTFFEATYSKGSNEYVNFRLKTNSASILAEDIDDFWIIFKFFGDLYEIRSSAVHGSDWAKKFEKLIKKKYFVSDENLIEGVIKFHKELISYLNASLLYLIEIMKNNSDIIEEINSDPLYFFNHSKITKELNIKREILKKIKQRYIILGYKYENRWEEIRALFNIEDIE